MPLDVVLHDTGPLLRVPVFPLTLNLNKQPSLDMYCRSAPLPADRGTLKVELPLAGGWPVHVTVLVRVPFHVAPVNCDRSVPEEPLPPHAAAMNATASPIIFIFDLLVVKLIKSLSANMRILRGVASMGSIVSLRSSSLSLRPAPSFSGNHFRSLAGSG